MVIRSEPVHSSTSPKWLPITMRVRTLCNGDYDRTIKINCYDHRSNGKHVLLGTCYCTLRELVKATESTSNSAKTLSSDKHMKMYSPHKSSSKKKNKSIDRSSSARTERKSPEENVEIRQKLSNESSGVLIMKEITVTEEISFIDYIKSGTQMHFAVAIDFTASNGPARDPHSLHFLDLYGGKPNSYEIALKAVGEIIQQYDSAGMFPAFGFGAKLPPNGEVSHQFPLNGNPSHPYCSSIEEIMQHYHSRLATVTLYGPTNFSLVIHNTAQIAAKFQDGKHYFILLIITDGIISDMHQTKNAIVAASRLPLSIIIVGVGNANFTAMDELDLDDIRLSIDGRYAERDIVQFVPLNKFLESSCHHGTPFIRSQAELAREVLAEIPDQMTSMLPVQLLYSPTFSFVCRLHEVSWFHAHSQRSAIIACPDSTQYLVFCVTLLTLRTIHCFRVFIRFSILFIQSS